MALNVATALNSFRSVWTEPFQDVAPARLIIENKDLVAFTAWSDTDDDVTVVALVNAVHDWADCKSGFGCHTGGKNVPGSLVQPLRGHPVNYFFARQSCQPLLLDYNPAT